MIQNNKIHLYTFYSPDYLLLKRRFEKSLQDNYIVHFIPFESDGKRTGTGGGINTWVFKTEKIIELIEKHNGEIIIFSDIDIQFFKSTEPVVRKLMFKHDIAFQREKCFKNVNIGFMAFRCNDQVKDFWNKVLEKVENNNTWDQKAVNELLKSGFDVNWGLFPESIWCWGLSRKWRAIVLHHSVATGNINTKLMQMRIVSAVYYMKWLNRFDITYKLARKIYRFYRRNFEQNRSAG